jgi:methionyl-tRNA formyltransferase
MNIVYLSNNPELDVLFEWLSVQSNVKVFYYSKKIIDIELTHYNPDLIISYGYKYIISKDIVDAYKGRIINLHTSYLPYNRGADPNLWSIIEDTKKGVTIHFIDDGIDTGPILFQKTVIIDVSQHTLMSSYQLLQDEIQMLFKENWQAIRTRNYPSFPKSQGGSIHYKKDLKDIKEVLLGELGWEIPLIDLQNNYKKLDHK